MVRKSLKFFAMRKKIKPNFKKLNDDLFVSADRANYFFQFFRTVSMPSLEISVMSYVRSSVEVLR